MNRSAEVVDYLTGTEDAESILIAPMAPPVARINGRLHVAIPQILDPSDVSDTLNALLCRTTGSGTRQLCASGCFSFGVKDTGRFRVNYMTQRGSKIVCITRIPVIVPDFEQFCGRTDLLPSLLQRMDTTLPGGLCVFGPNARKNSTLVYAIFQEINRTARLMIYCVERYLTCLMNHNNSIIIQSELSVDAPSMADGINTGLQLSPDLLFAGDVSSSDELTAVAHTMQKGVYTVFSITAGNEELLAHRLKNTHPETLATLRLLLKGFLQVTPAEAKTVKVNFQDSLPSLQ